MTHGNDDSTADRNATRETKQSTRRSVLRTVGSFGVAAAAATTIPVVGATEPDAYEIHEQAREIVERTGSAEKRERFLRKHNIPVTSTKNDYTMLTPQNNDGISTQYLDKNDLRIYLTMSKIGAEKWDTFIQWEWEKQDAGDWGEGPWDQIGLAWDDSHYFFDNDEVFSANKTDYRSSQIAGGTGGIVWSFNDPDGDGGDAYYGEVYTRYGANNVAGPRQIKGEYVHTYQGGIDMLQVGFPSGVTVIWNDSGESWSTSQQQTDGDPLIVSPRDTVA